MTFSMGGNLFKVQMTCTEWIAKDVGTIKSESYSENGKLMGKTLLTKLNK